MDLTFCKLKSKDVVNICDGKNLGNISDLIIDSTCGKILGLIVPASKNFFNLFKSSNDLFIPYNRVCKIGKDIILVDIIMQQNIDCCCNNINIQNLNQTQNNQKYNIQTILNQINSEDSL